LRRRRPHVGEEDSEEEMERKVKKREDSNEEKNVVTVPRNVKKLNLASNLETENKYDPLSDHEDTDLVDCQMEEDGEEEETQPQETKKEKPSPIIIHGNFGAKKLLKFCTESTKKQVLLKFTSNNTIILMETIDYFKISRDALKKSKTADWHTYTIKSEKTHAFVAYGLQNNPEPENVKSDLQSKGIAAPSLTCIR
jgi:hypothetical protein